MPDYDLRLDVPFRAFVNAKLIWLVQQGGTLWEAKKHLLPQLQLSDEQIYAYHLYDQAMALSLLYCMIVVPRELLNLPENHQLYRDFDAQQITKHFATIEPLMDSYLLIRCLRNSLAHALFSISEEHGHACYEFHTDQKPILNRAVIGHEALIRLINAVGKPLATAVLAQKSANHE